jgi:YHS domain-containing protein
MTTNPSTNDRPRDPVCGMAVRTDVATEDGLVAEYDSHTYYFCRQGCLDEFQASPTQYVTSHHHAEAVTAPVAAIEIDAGMRLWYESCSCCLSDAHPEVKAALDAEREANARPAVDAGICEVAEGKAADA